MTKHSCNGACLVTDPSQANETIIEHVNWPPSLPSPPSPHLPSHSCVSCVLGCFIRRCVVEYRKLTFTQLLRVHSIFRDFVVPMHEKGEGQGLEGGALQVKKTNCKQVCGRGHTTALLP